MACIFGRHAIPDVLLDLPIKMKLQLVVELLVEFILMS
jgi:hypothetical protein